MPADLYKAHSVGELFLKLIIFSVYKGKMPITNKSENV